MEVHQQRGGELNPFKWSWSGKTWLGVGIGAVIGGAGGYGFYAGAPALAKTAFFTHFGASGTVAAYTLTGGVIGGAIGYGSGYAGGMLHSNGDSNFAHKMGKRGAIIGSTLGGVLGQLAGATEMSKNRKESAPKYKQPQKPKWEGDYFTGTREEADDITLYLSKKLGMETSYYETSRGFYFERITGQAYNVDWGPENVAWDNSMNFTPHDYNLNIGQQRNSLNEAYRYTYFDKDGDYFYIGNIFQRARVYSETHTHPHNSPPSGADLLLSRIFGITGYVLGWSGVRYQYGGPDYFK